MSVVEIMAQAITGYQLSADDHGHPGWLAVWRCKELARPEIVASAAGDKLNQLITDARKLAFECLQKSGRIVNVTHNVAVMGYSEPGIPSARGLHILDSPDGKTWDSFEELSQYCHDHGVVAMVTPYEHTGGDYYYGSGGGRYLHHRAFQWPIETPPVFPE